jgi:tyrosinase
MGTRKNQKSLTQTEWTKLIAAIDQTHGVNAAAPAYRQFVKVHVQAMSMTGMSWGVHTMTMGGQFMRGRNFLCWHRWFILQFEKSLQRIDPAVTLPYWDAIKDRHIPAVLDNPALLSRWSVTRAWDPTILPTAADLTSAVGNSTFPVFQSAIEGAVHADVHNAVGGDMATASSPTDPLFFLHHANLDRIFAKWQASHASQNPPSLTEKLKPSPIFKVTVKDTLKISALGYSYQ